MEILNSQFITSSAKLSQCPEEKFPEFAFIGRSNVGKSTLINFLTGQKDLAKTSSKPGKTKLINHFLINELWYLVDLPGYGYAGVSKKERVNWLKFIEDYILKRKTLINLFVLLDSRLPPQKIDREFITWLGEHQVPFSLVFTKIDKPKERDFQKNLKLHRNNLKQQWDPLPPIFFTSATKKTGKAELLGYMEGLLKG